MFQRLTILIICFAVLTSACSLSTSPLPGATPTPVPTETAAEQPEVTPAATATTNIFETPDPRRFTAPDLSFTFIMPRGWTVQERGATYPDLQGPDENGIRPVISFQEEETKNSLDQYIAAYRDSFTSQNTGYKAIREETLSTSSGDPYLRWEFSNFLQSHMLHYTVYFYGSGNWNLVVTYIRRDDVGSTNDGPVDEAMKTVKFSR